MKTRRLVSTITYNTDLFFAELARRWVDNGFAEYVHWIRHLPETDETKSHIHVLLSPSRAIETRDLVRDTAEVDTLHEGMILNSLPWRPSKLDDWVLYSLHDSGYLATHGSQRDYHYSINEMCSTCPDLLREQYKSIDLRVYGLGQRLHEAVDNGESWEGVISKGLIPPQQFRYWKEVYFAIGGWSRGVRDFGRNAPPSASTNSGKKNDHFGTKFAISRKFCLNSQN